MTKEEWRKFKSSRFAAWYGLVPWTKFGDVNHTLRQKMGVSNQTIRNYYHGKTEIPEMALPIINEVAGADLFAQ